MTPKLLGYLWIGLLLASPVALAQPYAITTLLGSPDNPGTADGTNDLAQFTAPTGLALSSSGDLFVMDGNALRCVAFQGPNRVLQTLAGSMRLHAFVDGTNSGARFNAPQGVALDAAGNVYVADTFNNAIRKVSSQGGNWVVTTIAGPTPPATDFGSADGTNSTARFHDPYGITVDAATNIYVADTLNHSIRRIAPVGTNWVVTTLAGAAGLSGNLNATNSSARFNNPTGVAVGPTGDLYVADFANNMVRKLTQFGTNWAVTTLAGTPAPGSADGPGELAGFNSPQCVALDAAGNVFVTDSGNYTLRRITPQGVVSTVAGAPGSSGSVDGIGMAARFAQPYGAATSPGGTLFIADYLGYSIRQGVVAPLLHIAQSGQQIVLSWSAALTGCVLQTSSTPTGKNWQDQTNGVTLSGQFWTQTNALLPGANFYRLRFLGP